MEQYGFFSSSITGALETAKPRRRNRTAAAATATAKREYPPRLTTSLARQTGRLQTVTKRFNLVKRCADEGQRVVIEAEEIRDENHYGLRVRRANGRLLVSLIPVNEFHEANSCDDYDNDDHENIDCNDGDCEEEEEIKRSVDGDGDLPPKILAFPFFESVFEPSSTTVTSIM
ncbi:hypothetical protein L484_014987 [Morus notabilis]|uniref:Uncharacterized protein n=1 Tax=Morus notabilis TaxID=981085 RepID=W9SAH5_9ROSA|nr:hypothetical protein L484_014987 [Morus notabilis]